MMLLAFLLTTVGCANTNTFAENVNGRAKEKTLQVMDAYQPQRPEFMSMNAGYLKIQSLSDQDVLIVNVSSPDYQSVSIHKSIQVDGMHHMESMGSLKIPAGETLSLEPGGMHLMLHMPIAQRKVGDFTRIVFVLDDGSNVSFNMPVSAP
ncbi:MAG: copper(I)-binding protein [Oleispira sp.]|jgi:copper(I)-binding protein